MYMYVLHVGNRLADDFLDACYTCSALYHVVIVS